MTLLHCSEDEAASFGIVGPCAVVCRWPWMGADAGACMCAQKLDTDWLCGFDVLYRSIASVPG